MFVLVIGTWYVSKLELSAGDLPTRIEINSKCYLAKSYTTKQAAYKDLRAIQDDFEYPYRWPVKIKEI